MKKLITIVKPKKKESKEAFKKRVNKLFTSKLKLNESRLRSDKH